MAQVTQERRRSLGTAAARNLATTHKTVPHAQGITPRWLLRSLPWVQVSGGAYRVNRRRVDRAADGTVFFTLEGSRARVVPSSLRSLAAFSLVGEDELSSLASAFTQHEYSSGSPIGDDSLVLIVSGKAASTKSGKYGHAATVAVVAEGAAVAGPATALTAVTTLELPLGRLPPAPSVPPVNGKGEAVIDVASGHSGEAGLPGTFADYDPAPVEYELHVAQTVLQVHSRVADLYSSPMNQVDQQLRLTIEALRERQEDELINNPDIGLLASADPGQRIHTLSGTPTPDDLDELLTRRRKSRFFLAHPRAIAAFGRACTARSLYPEPLVFEGRTVPAWRGVPILPCDKIPVSSTGTTSILVLRTGDDDQGVVGLHQTGIPDEYEPGLSVRLTGIDEQAIMSYLVSAYYSVAVLVPDALGVLENVQL